MDLIRIYFPFLLGINLVAALAAFLIGIIVIKIFLAIFRGALRAGQLNQSLVDIVSSLTEAVLWFALGVIVVSALGFTEAAKIISLLGGAFVVAAGMGAQSFIANILAGFNLAIDEDFNVGYRIKINDIEGVVKKMDYRKIRLEDKQGVHHIFPNKQVEENHWLLLSKKS